MFWCITCDGYENRGKDILVVGHTDGIEIIHDHIAQAFGTDGLLSEIRPRSRPADE